MSGEVIHVWKEGPLNWCWQVKEGDFFNAVTFVRGSAWTREGAERKARAWLARRQLKYATFEEIHPDREGEHA